MFLPRQLAQSFLSLRNSSVIKPNKFYFRYLSAISSILAKPDLGKQVVIKGWVKNLRIQKEVIFADISDGSSAKRIQAVIPKALKPETLTYGSSVEVTGQLSTSPKGQLELKCENVNVLGECVISDGYPFNPRTLHPPEYLRQYLHLRSRTNYISAVLRIRNTVTMLVNDFFQSRNYLNIHTPILTSNDCEGAGEVFKVTPESKIILKEMAQEGRDDDSIYFGNKTFLTVSGQLHLESICRSMGNVYTFGPTFRAENSRSRLHLSEFYMLEAEVAFCKDLNELQLLIEDFFRFVVTETMNKNNADLKILSKENNLNKWLDKQFITLTYDEAISILDKKTITVDKSDGLNKEQELLLVEHCGGAPVFVVRWPKELKSFYMKESQDGKKVEALDLLLPITGEVIGGSLREDDYNKLKAKLPSDRLDWYLELRKFGNIPTGGFGLGLERLLQVLCDVNNIKDTIPFPRWPHNCDM